MKNKDEVAEKEVRSAVEEENSSSSESENQVESSRRITISPDVRAPHFPPKIPACANPPRLSRTLVLQEWSQKTTDDQQTSQVVKPKTKVPSKLDKAEHLVKIGLPSSKSLS